MTSPIDLYIIEKVKEKRVEKGISQEGLSIAAGFKSNGFIAQVESLNYGKKYNIQHLNKFAIILECSPQIFIPQEPFKEY